MEPNTPSCGGKRKNISPSGHGKSKRLKREKQRVEVVECDWPRISVPFDRLRQPITVKELTALLHYVALGKAAGIKKPSWCGVEHRRRLSGVTVVLVDGLTQSHFYRNYLSLKHLRTSYSSRVTFTPRSSQNVASEVFSSQVPRCEDPSVLQKSSQIHPALRSHPVILKFGTQRRGLSAYLLRQEDMIKYHYPVRGIPKFEDFVCTHSSDSVTDDSPVFGLDCEMCVTTQGNELTRVSVVDADGNCVLDHLVKPANRIVNYCTRFSGITAAMLRPVTTTLQDVQDKLRALLPQDAVLVGHSLNSDLVALKLIHRHVIDSSLLYVREFGQRFKLKLLAQVVLKKHIQTKTMLGHDSVEDAAAALEVAQYFIKTGPRQVVERHLMELWGWTIEEEAAATPTTTQSLRFADVLQTHQRSVAYFGKRCEVALQPSHQQWHNSDKEVLGSFRKRTQSSFLSVLRFSSFSDHTQQQQQQQHQPEVEQEKPHQRMSAGLVDMCVVFAGPFPEGFSETEVKRLFLSCGPVRKIQMLQKTVRLHARVEFQLLEGAVLALKTLDGLILHGQVLKVQRPVNESLLDLDLTLNALMDDALNCCSIYAVRSKRRAAAGGDPAPKVNGHTPAAALPEKRTNGRPPPGVDDLAAQLSKEEAITENFGHLGAIERVSLLAKPCTHARIKFRSRPETATALAEDQRIGRYVICPSLTPPHLHSWRVSAETTTVPEEDNCRTGNIIDHHYQNQEMEPMMRKLDRYLEKLFRSVPDCTLVVVLFPGSSSSQGQLPGLCFLEVKSGSGGEQ